MKLILASQSEARKRLLKALLGKAKFEIRPAHLDEEEIQNQILGFPKRQTHGLRVTLALARKVARRLAEEKAKAVFSELRGRDAKTSKVIGSDQLLLAKGKIVGKPGSIERALKFLKSVRGESALLITAVAVCDHVGLRSSVQVITLKFSHLSPREIRTITMHDRPLDCAGSFKIEGRGIGLFDSIESDDPTGIQGLPLLRLRRLLAAP